MQFLGHNHIDVLKIDVEGAEYDALFNNDNVDILNKVNQLVIEIHLKNIFKIVRK